MEIPKSALIVVAFVLVTLAVLFMLGSNRPQPGSSNVLNQSPNQTENQYSNTSAGGANGGNGNGNSPNSSSVANSGASGSSREVVMLQTSKGNIEILMDRAKAPITVQNFENYVKSGFYDATIFHRVILGFMIQGGGFTSDGSEKLTQAPIKLESNNGLKNAAGTIAMARTSVADSATAQFFINTVDNPDLDNAPGNDGYAVFGTVISGMDVVRSIESVATGVHGQYSDWPLEPVTITKAYME